MWRNAGQNREVIHCTLLALPSNFLPPVMLIPYSQLGLTGGLPTNSILFLNSAACCNRNTSGPKTSTYFNIDKAGWKGGSDWSLGVTSVMVLSARALLCILYCPLSFVLSAAPAFFCSDCSSQNSSNGAVAPGSVASVAAMLRNRAASSQLLPKRPYARLTKIPTLTNSALRSSALAVPLL